ncbi:MAG: neutral/alkaline non-lysosomal ceramidase N-terminal domain-containing protein, partial [Candidatus Lokiarchaeota archaeon]|nr:neutral/alkaline non-lysosomal ceramidase N-terminal domain-containing protein [Candidatus Lokiarchaeota archaeon]
MGKKTTTFLAGMNATRIALPEGVPLGGYSGRNDTSKGEHDPLHVRSAAIKAGDDTIVVVACDLVGLERNHIMAVKQHVHRDLGIPPAHVLVSATHTHSGPRNIALFGEPFAGHEAIYGTIERSIAAAVAAMEPARLSVASGRIGGVAFNRRVYDPTSEHVDDACEVLVVERDPGSSGARGGGVLGVIYNFSCHPVVMGADNLLVSADWVHYANERILAAHPGAIPLFLQGSSGNLNPVNTPLVGFVPVHTFDDCKLIGDQVGAAVVGLAGRAEPVPGQGAAKGVETVISIPADDADKAEIFTFADGEVASGKLVVSTSVQAITLDGIAFVG